MTRRCSGALFSLRSKFARDYLPSSFLDYDRSDDMRNLTSILTSLDAVRILVHRPFLLYIDAASDPPLYTSRESCRAHAIQMVRRLQKLKVHNLLHLSWPFTVYAIVNCLLVYWYDISASPTKDEVILSQGRREYAAVVELLRELSTTWWAAAAKYHLANALAIAADELQVRDQRSLYASPPLLHVPRKELDSTAGQRDMRMPEATTFPAWPPEAPSYWGENNDFWSSIGLDFDTDVADGVFSIFSDGVYP